jgi:hypothetical protein
MKRIIIIFISTVFLLIASSCKSGGCGCPGGAGYPKHNTSDNVTAPANNKV